MSKHKLREQGNAQILPIECQRQVHRPKILGEEAAATRPAILATCQPIYKKVVRPVAQQVVEFHQSAEASGPWSVELLNQQQTLRNCPNP